MSVSKYFMGIKCMLECLYWFKKDTNPKWDFGVGDGWKSLTDSDIQANHKKLVEYLSIDNSVCLVVNTPTYYVQTTDNDPMVESELFSRHNGIITRRFSSGEAFKYIAAPEDENGENVFAAIPTAEQKNLWISNKYLKRAHVRWSEDGVEVLWNNVNNYNLVTASMAINKVPEYLSQPYISGAPQVGIEELQDATTPRQWTPNNMLGLYNSADIKYPNIASIFNKSASNGYAELVMALTLIDPNLAEQLNSKIESMRSSYKPDKSDSLSVAISKMSGEG